MSKRKTYTELISLPTFKERFEYLKLGGTVGGLTFGPNRWINQRLYHSGLWIDFKRQIILRDDGCDLACSDRVIDGEIEWNGSVKRAKRPIYIHHLNPVNDEDILFKRPCVFDPENVVCCSFETHEAIHYGDYGLLSDLDLVVRTPNDTIPWRKTP